MAIMLINRGKIFKVLPLEVLQTIQKVQEHVERQLQSQRLPKTKLTLFDGNPLNYFLFLTSFKNSVHKCTEGSSERLQRLIQHCSGNGEEVIMSCGMMNADEGYPKAKKLLEERFGDKYKVTNAWIRQLSEEPVLKGGDRKALQDLADDLESCEITLRVPGRLGQSNNEDRLVKIPERVSGFIKSRWQKRVEEIRNESKDVRKFIRTAAKDKNYPVFGGIMDAVNKDERTMGRNPKRPSHTPSKGYIFSILAELGKPNNGNSRTKLTCYFCSGQHKLQDCTTFQNKISEQQLKFFHQRKLCENCLSTTHYASGCKGCKGCKSHNCMITRKHLESLHEGLWVNIENRKGEQSKKMVQEVTPAKALVAKEALRMLKADSQ